MRKTAFNHRLHLGEFLVQGGRPQDALDLYREAIDLAAKSAADVPTNLNERITLGRTHIKLGIVLAKAGNQEESETALGRALHIHEVLEQDFGGQAEDGEILAQSHCRAAEQFRQARRWSEAEMVCRLALTRYAELAAKRPTEPVLLQKVANCYGELALALEARGAVGDDGPQDVAMWKEAAGAFSRAIELGSDDMGGVWLPLALLHLKAGQTDEYRRLMAAALIRFGKTEELGVAINLAVLAKLAPRLDRGGGSHPRDPGTDTRPQSQQRTGRGDSGAPAHPRWACCGGGSAPRGE